MGERLQKSRERLRRPTGLTKSTQQEPAALGLSQWSPIWLVVLLLTERDVIFQSVVGYCLNVLPPSGHQVIKVSFDKFILEADTYCRFDYVAFFNGGERDDSRLIGKYCGDQTPA